ncbi:MAG TPA: tetratricopeptide repeat protein [Opitutaceae bacterium]|nr:tetratricopeptide repeat protein [Opitutaceae bacterium]
MAPPIPAPPRPRRERLVLGAVCAAVVAIYFASAHSGLWEALAGDPARSYYNEQVAGFREGRLSLAKPAPPGLGRLRDPYDPAANRPFRGYPVLAEDLSYFRGRFYLYFGVAPALLLFWPWVLLTGHYLLHRWAVAIFCSAGFLAWAWVLRAAARRHFPSAGPGALAAALAALGLATGMPVLLERSEVYEVAVGCAYALAALAIAALWRALEDPGRGGRWTAAASLALGLAVASRPPVLCCAPLLLLPAALAARGGGRRRLLAAAVLPIALCGLGLLAYNAARFGDPLEFGQAFQISGIRQDAGGHFGLRYAPYNLRVYFLQLPRWQAGFPYLVHHDPPKGPGVPEGPFAPFGILGVLPFVLLALAAPRAWRAAAGPRRPLAGLLAASGILFLAPLGVACLFFGSTVRYEEEFLPALVALAALGVLGLEAAPPRRRRAARAGWGLLLAYSAAAGLLLSVDRYALEHTYLGSTLDDLGLHARAVAALEAATRANPSSTDARTDLGVALAQSGRLPEAIAQFQAALRLDPRRADTLADLGNGLVQTGQLDQGIEQYRRSLALRPGAARTRFNLALALAQQGRRGEALEQYREAVRLDPSLAAQR